MADAQQSFGSALPHTLQVLRQRRRLRFRRDQTPVFFPEGFFAAQAEPALMAVARAAVFDSVIRLAMGAVHPAAYNTPTIISIPV